MANAGAFTARADDPSALFFNPAGIVQLDGIRLAVGANAIFLTGSTFDSTASGNGFSNDGYGETAQETPTVRQTGAVSTITCSIARTCPSNNMAGGGGGVLGINGAVAAVCLPMSLSVGTR